MVSQNIGVDFPVILDILVYMLRRKEVASTSLHSFSKSRRRVRLRKSNEQRRSLAARKRATLTRQ